MNGTLNAESIIGIKLRGDGLVTHSESNNEEPVVGSIICSDSSMKCNVFRILLDTEIQSLPENYIFLSKNWWPIDKTSETEVAVSQLIRSSTVTIQRHFDLPRLGIKWHNGDYLGFIFISFNSSLIALREAIYSELRDKFLHPDSKFEFLDRNDWPVTTSQERVLSVWDVCVRNTCTISKLTAKRKSMLLDHRIRKKNLKLPEKKDFKVARSDQVSNSTSILISYVHAEANTHARDLKSELINMGIDSVFLDVDDIQPGCDWQDVINTALNNCSAFVALVTPRYGETRWTNREAKLADDKEKKIIPVSFLSKWPPDQLAIQFLTLQYIPWILRADFVHDSDYTEYSGDIARWDQRCVHRVAKEIKKLCSEDASTPDSVSLIDARQLINGYYASSSSHQPRVKNLILISAHCAQKTFVEMLSGILEEDYRVCSFIDGHTENGDFSSNENSLSESCPYIETFSHSKSTSRLNSCEADDGSKADTKSYFCPWKDSPDEGNFQCNKSKFKSMVKMASLVILINSEEYNNSRNCKQQAFYCEQRIGVIVIKYGSFTIGHILLNLYPEQDMLEISMDEISQFQDGNGCNNFIRNLKKEISKSLETNKSKYYYKDHIQNKVSELKKEIASEFCVYVIGGTNSISQNAERFCINLGSELAKLEALTLVTEGFFGAGEIVGKNFCEEKEIRAKGKPPSIFHVVPYKDQSPTKRARQREDGSFEKIPYGRTLFYGNSIIERDDIVSSAFKICILIEGGERSACLAEKFLWNDCTVVPILFNNRAISSKTCLFASISKPPCGVHDNDWDKLDNWNDVEELAKTVRKIVFDLLKLRSKLLKIKQ